MSHLLWQVESATTFLCLLSLPGPTLPFSFPPFLAALGTLTCGSGEKTFLGCTSENSAIRQEEKNKNARNQKKRGFCCHLVLPFFHLDNQTDLLLKVISFLLNWAVSQTNCLCHNTSNKATQRQFVPIKQLVHCFHDEGVVMAKSYKCSALIRF